MIVDLDTNRVLASFQLDKDLIGQTTCELARLVHDNGAWRFENLSHPVMSLTGALTSRVSSTVRGTKATALY